MLSPLIWPCMFLVLYIVVPCLVVHRVDPRRFTSMAYSPHSGWILDILLPLLMSLTVTDMHFGMSVGIFLPPANEVWGKVMILIVSVILSVGGGGSV